MSDELRDEQQFLLNSIRDLEKEREAGDIDDADYETLRSGYVARTAAITRELEGLAAAAEGPQQSWVRRLLVVACVLGLAIGAGVFVANSAGQRLPGETITGAIEQSTANILATARQLNFTDPAKSIELYTRVLKLEPDNTEALTYRAWMLALSSREADVSVKQLALATAVADLIRAQNADPSFPIPGTSIVGEKAVGRVCGDESAGVSDQLCECDCEGSRRRRQTRPITFVYKIGGMWDARLLLH
jgi:hypothetical protein